MTDEFPDKAVRFACVAAERSRHCQRMFSDFAAISFRRQRLQLTMPN